MPEGFVIRNTCASCVHWSYNSVAPECTDGFCAVDRKDVPMIGWCPAYGRDLRGLEVALGDLRAMACLAEPEE